MVSVTAPAAAAQEENEQNQAKHDDPRVRRVISSVAIRIRLQSRAGSQNRIEQDKLDPEQDLRYWRIGQ